MNPGPNNINTSLPILHSNIRSKRIKFDYLTDDFFNFDILCFSESHLDATTEFLIMSSKNDIPYRKDRTSHGAGVLIYCPVNLHIQEL